MRYYYKTKDGKGLYNLKSPSTDKNLIAITESEFLELQPKERELTAEQKQQIAIQNEMNEILAWLNKNDFVINKHLLGEYADNDQRWLDYLAERETKLARYNELEKLL